MPDFRFSHFLDQFVIGSLVFLGIWYLHRPFLLQYFPNLAGDRGAMANGDLEIQAAILLFSVGAICCGVVLTHSADLMTIATFKDDSGSEKSERKVRRTLRNLASVITWGAAPDARVRTVRRYLASKRRDQFLEMAKHWAMTDENALANPAEAVLAHQHIVARMRAHSAPAREVLEAAYAQVRFAGGLALAFIVLIPITSASFVTSIAVQRELAVLPIGVRVGVLVSVYIAAVLASYSFRRRFRDFAAVIVTHALHFFTAEGSTQGAGKRKG